MKKYKLHEIPEKLSHLSEKQIFELIEAYYAGEKLKDLVEKYQIEIRPGALLTVFPSKVLEESKCLYCQIPLVQKFEGRSSAGFSSPRPLCRSCGHAKASFCYCKNCKKEEEKRKESIRKMNQDFLNDQYEKTRKNPVDYKALEWEDKITLGALLRSGLSQDLKSIKPICEFGERFSPRSEFTHELIAGLYKKNIIVIDPEKSLNAFIYNELLKYDFTRVFWQLNVISAEMSREDIITSLLNPEPLKEENISSATEVWKRLALEESYERLIHEIKTTFRIDYSITEKTHLIFDDLITKFPTSKLFYIIYKSGKDIVYAEKHVPFLSRQKSAVATVNKCQKNVDRALAEAWNIKHSFRPRECPQTAYSKFCYDRILGIGEAGFEEIPDQSYLMARLKMNND